MAKVHLDKFYTKKEIAQKCLSLIPDMGTYDTIIEPSAGSGVFSNAIANCIAYDIEPEGENIIKQDFFLLNKIEGDKKLFLGNPPFGERSILAKKFIQHAIHLGAETIAFILPDTFSKFIMQKVFPLDWNLIVEENLGRDGFEIQEETYHVPCSFYIWTKRVSEVNLRKKELPKPRKIKFLPRLSQDADFTINGNNGKIKELDEVTNWKSEHYIKVLVADEKDAIKKQLSAIKYSFKSSVNGGNAWISQYEILEEYYNNGIEQISPTTTLTFW
jgi:predicted RNA methylase